MILIRRLWMVQVNEGNMGELVRHHRRKRKLTQYNLAVLAGVGKTMVFDLEKGKKTVKMNSLFKVLEALNIKLICECVSNDAKAGHHENQESAS